MYYYGDLYFNSYYVTPDFKYLHIITHDQSLLEVDLATGEVSKQQRFFSSILKRRERIKRLQVDFKSIKSKDPDKFHDPILTSGEELESVIVEDMRKTFGDSIAKNVSITLLIDKAKGRAIILSVVNRQDLEENLLVENHLQEFVPKLKIRTGYIPAAFEKSVYRIWPGIN